MIWNGCSGSESASSSPRRRTARSRLASKSFNAFFAPRLRVDSGSHVSSDGAYPAHRTRYHHSSFPTRLRFPPAGEACSGRACSRDRASRRSTTYSPALSPSSVYASLSASLSWSSYSSSLPDDTVWTDRARPPSFLPLSGAVSSRTWDDAEGDGVGRPGSRSSFRLFGLGEEEIRGNEFDGRSLRRLLPGAPERRPRAFDLLDGLEGFAARCFACKKASKLSRLDT